MFTFQLKCFSQILSLERSTFNVKSQGSTYLGYVKNLSFYNFYFEMDKVIFCLISFNYYSYNRKIYLSPPLLVFGDPDQLSQVEEKRRLKPVFTFVQNCLRTIKKKSCAKTPQKPMGPRFKGLCSSFLTD
jgi:hypothetical protein